MNFENVPNKHMNELELLTRKLLVAMRKAKLQNESLEQALRSFEQELEDTRRKRFDTANSEYHTY